MAESGSSFAPLTAATRQCALRLAETMDGLDQLKLSRDPLAKKNRKARLLGETHWAAPWGALVVLIQPPAIGAHQALGGRPPVPMATRLRIHCLQLWRSLCIDTVSAIQSQVKAGVTLVFPRHTT
jgi:hypothetical protein